MKRLTATPVGARFTQLKELIARRRRLQLVLAMLLGFLLGLITMLLFNSVGVDTEQGPKDRPAAVSDTLHHWFQHHDDD